MATTASTEAPIEIPTDEGELFTGMIKPSVLIMETLLIVLILLSVLLDVPFPVSPPVMLSVVLPVVSPLLSGTASSVLDGPKLNPFRGMPVIVTVADVITEVVDSVVVSLTSTKDRVSPTRGTETHCEGKLGTVVCTATNVYCIESELSELANPLRVSNAPVGTGDAHGGLVKIITAAPWLSWVGCRERYELDRPTTHGHQGPRGRHSHIRQ